MLYLLFQDDYWSLLWMRERVPLGCRCCLLQSSNCWANISMSNDRRRGCRFLDNQSDNRYDHDSGLRGWLDHGSLAYGWDWSVPQYRYWGLARRRGTLGVVALVVWLEITWISHSPFFAFFFYVLRGRATLPVIPTFGRDHLLDLHDQYSRGCHWSWFGWRMSGGHNLLRMRSEFLFCCNHCNHFGLFY